MSSNAIPDISIPACELASDPAASAHSCVHDTLPPTEELDASGELEGDEPFGSAGHLEPHDTIPAPPWHADAAEPLDSSSNA